MKTPKEKGPSTAMLDPSGVLSVESFDGRIDRYASAKKRGLQTQEYLKSIKCECDSTLNKPIFRLEKCGSYLLFHHYLQQNEHRLTAADFCMQHLLCPLCAIRRGAKALQAYLLRYEAIKASKSHLKPFLATLTVKDGESLTERFSHLQKAVRALNKRRSGRNSGKSTWCSALAGVGSYEIKRGEGSGLWHPHIHFVILCDPNNPVNQFKLSKEWEAITGDSKIVDVRPIDDSEERLVDGFQEVFKYACKFSTMEQKDLYDAWRLLKGTRLLTCFGLFFGVEVPENLTDEELDGEYIELLYRFNRLTSKYVEESRQT
jgi:plasmid rolling circle replication initiator protein Rep